MKTAMESIKEMVDVDVVVGDPVEAPDGTVIMPVSRVTCGFAAGGSDYQKDQRREEEGQFPFGGGSGGGISVRPVGFLVVGNNQVRLLPIDGNPTVDRLIDMAPVFLDKVKEIFQQP